jgi:hypothetical protein
VALQEKGEGNANGIDIARQNPRIEEEIRQLDFGDIFLRINENPLEGKANAAADTSAERVRINAESNHEKTKAGLDLLEKAITQEAQTLIKRAKEVVRANGIGSPGQGSFTVKERGTMRKMLGSDSNRWSDNKLAEVFLQSTDRRTN